MLTTPFISLFYAFIVRRSSIFSKCAALVSLRFLHVLDRGLDFPQEHFSYVAGGRAQPGNRIQRIEANNAL
ncbi:hypothetical protein [Pelotomaculum sp. PtaB.Bin117]|uniref:hypothetical protein n=1 Tax=Pelotomaculum sp. PtaB.Bin117 TaxID=1811694 RepID=UPI00257AB106|nr:hypothetical protein [Pelotomaculum sp. PtaB.Bin117]